jgi:hypothetical protein
MTADPTPAADPRLAELTERHHRGAIINRIGPNMGKAQCDYCVRPWPCDAAQLLALLPARTATTEAATLAAALERLVSATPLGHHIVLFPPSRSAGWDIAIGMGVGPWLTEGHGPTLPDAIAAALAATGGE